MCKWFEHITGNYKSSAKIAGSKLVLSFPDALTPVTWQMDIASKSESKIELETNKDGTYNLVSKEGNKNRQVIASFYKRGTAIRALMRATNALERGLKKNGSSDASVIIQKPSFLGGLFKALITTILVIAILVALFTWVLGGIATNLNGGNLVTGGLAPTSQQQTAPSNTEAVGVPLSADDFLKGN